MDFELASKSHRVELARPLRDVRGLFCAEDVANAAPFELELEVLAQGVGHRISDVEDRGPAWKLAVSRCGPGRWCDFG